MDPYGGLRSRRMTRCASPPVTHGAMAARAPPRRKPSPVGPPTRWHGLSAMHSACAFRPLRLPSEDHSRITPVAKSGIRAPSRLRPFETVAILQPVVAQAVALWMPQMAPLGRTSPIPVTQQHLIRRLRTSMLFAGALHRWLHRCRCGNPCGSAAAGHNAFEKRPAVSTQASKLGVSSSVAMASNPARKPGRGRRI